MTQGERSKMSYLTVQANGAIFGFDGSGSLCEVFDDIQHAGNYISHDNGQIKMGRSPAELTVEYGE